MSYPGGWRPHIESALAIDIWRMDKLGALDNGARGSWCWSRGDERVAEVGYVTWRGHDSGTLTLSYTQTNRGGDRASIVCELRLSSIPLHLGGRRWYGHCPYTGRRARKLYKFRGVDQFCHRTAIRPAPTYLIQRLSGVDRIQAQRWALRRKLGDNVSGLLDGPLRPKWMRWRTFQTYAERDEELAVREDRTMSGHLARMIARLG